MSMVANAYDTNQNLSHPKIVDLLATGFSGTLLNWWDKHLTEGSREDIRKAVKKTEDGLPIFYKKVGRGEPDGVNTLIYTIIKHFVDTPSNITSRISDYLNNLRCPTMSDYRWYQDIFLSCVMFRPDSQKPYWKEKFIDGLPSLFTHKVKDELIDANTGLIDYDKLTYGDLFATVKKLGIKMCIDQKMIRQQLKNAKKAKYEMSNFCEQFGLSPIAPSRKDKKKSDKVFRKKPAPYYNDYKKRNFNKPSKNFPKTPKTNRSLRNLNLINIFCKENALTVENLGILLTSVQNLPKRLHKKLIL
jgi:hypothetical protein